jgi:hypothetical protein
MNFYIRITGACVGPCLTGRVQKNRKYQKTHYGNMKIKELRIERI